MITLDKRLSACAERVRGDVVCDIGTDHGYLPVYLLQCGRCARAVVTDIHAAPLDSARSTAAAAGVTDRVDFCLCDGSSGAEIDNVTDVVIAGMGGEQISRIILSDARLREKHIITQPMTKIVQMRRELLQGGFSIEHEAAVVCGRHIYTVICFEYSGLSCDDEIACHLGGLSPVADDDVLFVKEHLRKLRTAAKGMAESDPERSRGMLDTALRIEQRFFGVQMTE